MTERGSLSTSGTAPELQDLSPSAKLVVKTLENEGDLTRGQLAELSRLSPRTVRYATSQLEEADLVTARISFVDARKRVYSLEERVRP